MATPVEEGDFHSLEAGESGGDDGEGAEDSHTNSSEFVVATLMVTSVLTLALDSHRPAIRRPWELPIPRSRGTQRCRPWRQTVRMTGE